MANSYNTVFYTGVSNSIIKRDTQHKTKIIKGFTKKYHIDKLVYYEHFIDINATIEREKKIKKLSRRNKLLLIKKFNPELKDLSDKLK
jgi:putative endonuclease